MVKVPRTRSVEPARTGRHTQDIIGLLLFFFGAAGLLCLVWKQEGMLPEPVAAMLRTLAGDGAFVLPLLLMFVGTMFLIGYERLSFSRSTYGTILLFFVFVSWRHLVRIPAKAPYGNAEVQHAGGWIGALFGSALSTLSGPTISYLFLVTMTAIAIVLMIDQPFIVLLRHLYARSQQGAEAAKRGMEAGAARLPKRQQTAVVNKRPERAPEVEQERAERASRVVERALVSANSKHSPAQETLPLAEDEPEEESSTASKLFRMFNLSRSWGRSDEEAREEEVSEEKTVAESGVKPVAAVEAEAKPARRAVKAGTEPAALPAAKPEAEPAPAREINNTIFVLPPLKLLKETPPAIAKRSQAELTDNVQKIEQTLEQFNIGANVVEVASGPSVTRYEIQLAPGIKVSKIVSLADNLAMSLAAIDVRVEAPIPGKSAIGVEVPNANHVTVSLRECLETKEFQEAPSKLTFALGKDVSGQYKYADLAKMPHLLIGGSTNSGKSVCLNVIIASLVYRATPREVKMLMIDPKRVELSLWDGIPHLMHPVVKDVRLASGIFRAALREMDRRYDLFAALGTRNLEGYNQRVSEAEKLPFLVLIVDELADLMMQQGPEIETSICRLAQLARATGIHLIIATQRPSVDIITGTIKANISSRIAFAVASQVDSRTILDMTGADRLIGRGDMLFMPIDAAKPVRIQGSYLSENETNSLVDYLKQQEKPEYSFSLGESEGMDGGGRSMGLSEDDVDDAFFEQAVRLVVNNGQASTSMLQRRFRIGYTRAARIVEMMEERGIVGQLNGAKPREILVSKDEVERMFNPGFIPGVDDYEDEE